MKKTEAQILAGYISGSTIRPDIEEKYRQALKIKGIEHPDAETYFVLRHPFWLPYLDAATRLTAPGSILQKRLMLMFALLETSPDLSHQFLPRKQSRLILIPLTGALLRGLFFSLTGLIARPIIHTFLRIRQPKNQGE